MMEVISYDVIYADHMNIIDQMPEDIHEKLKLLCKAVRPDIMGDPIEEITTPEILSKAYTNIVFEVGMATIKGKLDDTQVSEFLTGPLHDVYRALVTYLVS